MQDQDVAPLRWLVQRRTGGGKRMIDERQDLTLQAIRALAGIDVELPVKLVVAELIPDCSITGVQRFGRA
jgi:hypothetical protein